jgi:signal peptidase
MVWRYIKHVATGMLVLAVLAGGLALLVTQLSGAKLLSVQSESMTPALKKGDLITVTRVPGSQLAVGDVITFVNPHNNKQTITHRIVQLPSAATGGNIITRGDANPVADTPISPKAVVGKVDARVPLAGYLVDFVRKPLGLLLLIYIPALVIMAQEFRRLVRHYKKLQPYRVPGREARVQQPTNKERLAAGTKLAAFVVVMVLSVVVPVKAALQSEATLSDNSITTVPQSPAAHIMLRRVEFECSFDNTELVNKLPGIIMHNPTGEDINTSGWYIESSAGRIVTFPSVTFFDAHDDFDIEPDLQAGVNYAGDFLALFDANGNLVDAISWGTDTTYLNPALPGTKTGTVFRRVGLIFDTNTAVDWAVSVSSCTNED